MDHFVGVTQQTTIGPTGFLPFTYDKVPEFLSLKISQTALELAGQGENDCLK